jgi:Holliday junction DNA helicase RuvA
MIEYLKGELIEKKFSKAIILCSGVGYSTMISTATYEQLPDIGQEISLYIHLVIREDSLSLFGFSDKREKEMFLLLIEVNGVGAKTAIGILSASSVDVLRQNIMCGNSGALTKLPGIGKKTADRITLELRDKIASVSQGDVLNYEGSKASVRSDALAGLMVLGYSRQLAENMIRSALKIDPNCENSSDLLLKASLKYL